MAPKRKARAQQVSSDDELLEKKPHSVKERSAVELTKTIEVTEASCSDGVDVDNGNNVITVTPIEAALSARNDDETVTSNFPSTRIDPMSPSSGTADKEDETVTSNSPGGIVDPSSPSSGGTDSSVNFDPSDLTECEVLMVDKTKSCRDADRELDGLPASNYPGLPDKDLIAYLREDCLKSTYKRLPLMKVAKYYLYNSKGGQSPGPRGFAFVNLMHGLSSDQVDFFHKSVSFVAYNNEVINLSRANPYYTQLRFKQVESAASSYSNRFLTVNGKPVQCVSVVLIQGSNLLRARTYGNGPYFSVKDVRVRFLRYEMERLAAFICQVLKITVVYFNGVAIGTPCINIGTRFDTLDASPDENGSTPGKWAPIPNETYPTLETEDGSNSNEPKLLLYPNDEVPIYDFSDLSFNFGSHFRDDRIGFCFDRVFDEPAMHTPAIISYYLSTYVKDNKQIVSFNIKWLGVL